MFSSNVDAVPGSEYYFPHMTLEPFFVDGGAGLFVFFVLHCLSHVDVIQFVLIFLFLFNNLHSLS